MLYQPRNVREMWDTWFFHENGVHYLFTLHKSVRCPSDRLWDGISLSTSTDGVHFEERGEIISKRPDAEWLGTGSTWKVGDKYYLNFSECRAGVQSIFIAESSDLLHWHVLDGSECRPDPRWYVDTAGGRWDCFWTVPLPDGGYTGYLTAIPREGPAGSNCASVGRVVSDDGISWRAAPPPVLDWGDMPALDVGEVGAVEYFGGRYHMMVGMGEERLGCRQLWLGQGRQYGMYHFVADDPRGPFRPGNGTFRTLCAPGMMTYFSRFYGLPDAMLVCHQSCELLNGRMSIYLAPLKEARADGEEMRLAWWPGNERMLGPSRTCDLAALESVYAARGATWNVEAACESAVGESPAPAIPAPALVAHPGNGGIVLRAAERFDSEAGAAIDVEFTLDPPRGRSGSFGIWLGLEGGGRFALLMESRGRTVLGRLGDGGDFTADYVAELGAAPGAVHRARLLARRSLVELYMDDLLVQCYSLPRRADGVFGVVLESAEIRAGRLALRPMDL